MTHSKPIMTFGEVQNLRDEAEKYGDTEFTGNCFFPRVVARLANTTFYLYDRLQKAEEQKEKIERAARALLAAVEGD